ncbi:MAG: sigma-54-dependent transcriptional regulator, partial [Candidatus Zixiibacteriota bacterium]
MPANPNSRQSNVLIFESIKTSDNSLKIAMPDTPYNFTKVGTLRQFTAALELKEFALIIINAESEIQNTIDMVKTARCLAPETSVLVITDKLNQKLIEVMTVAGAADCLERPISGALFMSRIKNLCELTRTRGELMMLKQQVAMSYAFDNFIGVSAEIQKIKRTIQNLVNSEFTVILSGEDGTGKNLLAKIIHYHSLRRKSPLSEMDCSAATTAQIETELFGSLSQTSEPRLLGGLFKRGLGGTVFIDKLHLVDSKSFSSLQSLLLQNVTSPGAIKSDTGNFRLMISVNESMYNLYSKRVMDRKLADGLNAIEIFLPPLRERLSDIELLIGYFVRMIAFENDAEPCSITPAAIEMLKTHQWPGNVRELENCIRRASVLCSNGCIDIADVSFISGKIELNRMTSLMKDRPSGARSMAETQRHLISEALDANEWNFTQTARQLGIGRTTL